MGALELVEKDTVAYELKMWVCMHDMWVQWRGQGISRMLLTGCMVRICQYLTYRCDQAEVTFLAWG
jgi:hypothetical protein